MILRRQRNGNLSFTYVTILFIYSLTHLHCDAGNGPGLQLIPSQCSSTELHSQPETGRLLYTTDRKIT